MADTEDAELRKLTAEFCYITSFTTASNSRSYLLIFQNIINHQFFISDWVIIEPVQNQVKSN